MSIVCIKWYFCVRKNFCLYIIQMFLYCTPLWCSVVQLVSLQTISLLSVYVNRMTSGNLCRSNTPPEVSSLVICYITLSKFFYWSDVIRSSKPQMLVFKFLLSIILCLLQSRPIHVHQLLKNFLIPPTIPKLHLSKFKELTYYIVSSH